MGMFFGKKCWLYDNDSSQTVNQDALAPNPLVFEIINICQINNNVVAWVKYPNCGNYEGNKILVFKNNHFTVINALKELDPHFSEDNENSPFARFEPTADGWNAAIGLAKIIYK